MKFNRSFWIAFALLAVWLVLGWFLGTWMGIKPPAIWYLRVGLWVLGIAGFAGYLVLRPKDESAPLEGAAANSAAEIEFNFNEASKRIQAATGNKQLNSLAAIFVIGDEGSAKTSIIAQSGIEPELVAGQAMHEGVVVPTRSVNLWYSRNTLFIDPGGSVVADPGARKKLFKKFLPVQLNSILASKSPATRSVLLTLDCDTFLQPGGANALAAKARDYQAILSELSRELGASFPVYVLFTKTDKIPYFRDFVENLTEPEASEALGVSLPLPPTGVQGAYAEQQSLRLNNAFQTIYYSLADRRPVYLGREHTAANLSNIYEFPREFAKLRPLLVQFLVDLCRPSQLGTTPFLRGFYFSGVRPVTISDVVPASQMPLVEDAGFDSGATRMFNRPIRSAPSVEGRQGGSRRVPQWVFLRNLFPGILLADRVGTTAAATNVKVNFARRAMLATFAIAALAMAGWWTVSYSNNSTLVHNAADAARSVPAVGLTPGQLASLDSLQRLSKVRDTLAVLNDYERNGAPLGYRALLYKGDDIREPLRATYYALFRRLLLQPTQQTLVQISTKPEGSEAQGYQYVYDVLKSYLITTNHHEKQWGELALVLTQHWKKDQTVDAEREKLAASNFEFYAGELPESNPYPQFATPDSLAVENARAFLRRFAQEDRIYRSMLDAAGDKLKPIVFNRDFPGTEDTVHNMFRVEPWFMKTAYTNFQKQLANPDAYFNGEEWVLGKETTQNFDKAKMVSDLRTRYDQDFVKAWRDYLAATSESIPYSNYMRAASVLEKLGGPQSPLMQLFCVASENTSVPNKDVAQAFQPVQLIAPAGCMRQLVSAAASPYVAGLGNLANSLKAIGPVTNPNPAAEGTAQGSVSNAETAETALVVNFQSDPTDAKATVISKSGSLLKDPIEDVRATLQEIAGAVINEQAAGACAAINPVFHKYPFNPAAKEDASLQEVNELLKPPDGKLWKFVNGTLAPTYVEQAGNDYIAKSGQPSKVTAPFLAFLNRAFHLSQALYHGDAAGNPNMSFTIQALPSQDVDHVTLVIDGTTLSGDPKTKPSQTFTWPGSAPGANLQVRYGSSPNFTIFQSSGLWAIWHVLDTAERGAGGTLEWKQGTSAGVTTIGGSAAAMKFSLDPQSAQILRPQYFAGLGCPSKAVQ